MKLQYDVAKAILKKHKIVHYVTFKGIPVDKFEREELLKIIDLYCDLIKIHQNENISINSLKSLFNLRF